VQGSLTGTSSPLPPHYSTDPNSAYYAMVKEVYDISQALTEQQNATALYHKDNPGFQSGTHYISIFKEVMHNENPQLDFMQWPMQKQELQLQKLKSDAGR
jgi:phage-related protein